MSNRQEVKIRTGALTKGTRHQCDKGAGLEHQVRLRWRKFPVVPRGGVWWKS